MRVNLEKVILIKIYANLIKKICASSWLYCSRPLLKRTLLPFFALPPSFEIEGCAALPLVIGCGPACPPPLALSAVVSSSLPVSWDSGYSMHSCFSISNSSPLGDGGGCGVA